METCPKRGGEANAGGSQGQSVDATAHGAHGFTCRVAMASLSHRPLQARASLRAKLSRALTTHQTSVKCNKKMYPG